MLLPFAGIIILATVALCNIAGHSIYLLPNNIKMAMGITSALLIGIAIPLIISTFSNCKFRFTREFIQDSTNIIYYQIPGTILIGFIIYLFAPLISVVFFTTNIFLFASAYTATKLLLEEDNEEVI
jgi:hypothetical protein